MFQIGFLSTNFAYIIILAAFYVSYLGVFIQKPVETNFGKALVENSKSIIDVSPTNFEIENNKIFNITNIFVGILSKTELELSTRAVKIFIAKTHDIHSFKIIGYHYNRPPPLK